jgi:pilus assembly protein Flp/PilA
MRAFVQRLIRDESGATALEYGLIISLMFLVFIGALTAFGNQASDMFNRAFEAIRTGISS